MSSNSVIRISSRSSLYIFLSSSLHTSSHPTLPRKHVNFEDINSSDEAVTVFHDMLKMRPSPSTRVYNKLLDTVSKMRHYTLVVLMFKKMSVVNVPVNDYTRDIVVNSFCNMGEVEFGFPIIAFFLKMGYPPNVVSFTCLIRGFFLKQDVSQAVFLFKSLIRCNFEFNEYTISTVLDGLVKSGRLLSAIELLEMSEKRKWILDVVCYNILMDGLCRARRLIDGMDLVYRMIDRNILPDIVTYNILIHSLCNHKKLDLARTMFHHHLSSERISPDVITYNVMIQGHCREGLFQYAQEMLMEMNRCGCLPNDVTYNIIIQGCLHHPNNIYAVDFLKQIVGMDFQLDAPTFFLILREIQVLRQMHGTYDDNVVYHLMQKVVSTYARLQVRGSHHGDVLIQSLEHKLRSKDCLM